MKYPFQYFLVLLLFTVLVTTSCKEKNKEVPQKAAVAESPGYNINKPEELQMKKKLKEISGIHYLKDSMFLAIEDEDGIIFTVDFYTGKIMGELAFGGNGDYEDVTMDGDFFYVLESSGTIFRVPSRGDESKIATFTFPGSNAMEFESIYLDSDGKNLVLICKNCPGDRTAFNAYRFNIVTQQFDKAPAFSIDATGGAALTEKASQYKPSAAAIHPIEKKLYVLCSIGKLLLVCDLHGKVENVYHLDPGLYKQPEGIAFTPNGDMFICNEANGAEANILKLVYGLKN